MRPIVVVIVLSGILAQACQHPAPPPGKEPVKPGERTAVTASNNISANSLFGPVQITAIQNMCAGQIKLAQGSATVKDSCFTGDTNIVLCTDSTAVSAIRCAPGVGNLQVTGTGDDLINYARIR
jgi:hypothetical protein